MTFRPIPRSYKTHAYCTKCQFWHKLSDVGYDVIRCPDCNYRIRRISHSSLSKSVEGRAKNALNQKLTRAGISLY